MLPTSYPVRQCENPQCRKDYEPNNPNGKYCPECRVLNAAGKLPGTPTAIRFARMAAEKEARA